MSAKYMRDVNNKENNENYGFFCSLYFIYFRINRKKRKFIVLF